MTVQKRLHSASWLFALQLAAVLIPGASYAQRPTTGREAGTLAARYESAFSLRSRWEHMTSHVADMPSWSSRSDRLVYRRTVLGGHEFVAVELPAIAKRPAFDHARLADALSTASGRIYSPVRLPFTEVNLTADGSALEMVIDGRPWRCGLPAYNCEVMPSRLPGYRGSPVRDMDAAFDSSARRSPDGRLTALVRGHNLLIQVNDDSTGTVALTRDGTATGFYDHASITWSPDSRHIAIIHVQPGVRRTVHYVDAGRSEQLHPRHFSITYAKPGDTIDRERLVIFDVESATAIRVPDELIPNPYQLTNFQWRRDAKTFLFDYNERGHQRFHVIEVNVATGRARALIEETSRSFVNYLPASGALRTSGAYVRRDVNDGEEIIWMSERDGSRHLYLYDGRSGAVKNQITRGDYIVRSILRVDEVSRRIWFTASGMVAGQDPYFAHAYRVNFDGSGLVPLTEADATHEVSFSPDNTYYVVRYSRIDLPPILELRRSADGALLERLEQGDVTALKAAGWTPPEVFTARGRDGVTDIWGIIVRPTHFDPGRKYPVIENIYAGPHGSFVPKAFAPFLPHSGGDGIVGMQAQAELGFIVVQIDGMGTGNRSKRFHDVAWRDLKDAGFPDRLSWHRAVAQRYAWYDTTRVGIYGASAGGQNAVAALLFHGDFYKAAVAYNGNHDNRMDKIWWNELWMGWPVGDHYVSSSNVEHAHRLQGEVLIIVGALDTNVDPMSSMQLVDAFIKSDKDFELLVVPDGDHATGRTTGPINYVVRRQYDFFVRHLLRKQPPDRLQYSVH